MLRLLFDREKKKKRDDIEKLHRHYLLEQGYREEYICLLLVDTENR